MLHNSEFYPGLPADYYDYKIWGEDSDEGSTADFTNAILVYKPDKLTVDATGDADPPTSTADQANTKGPDIKVFPIQNAQLTLSRNAK